MHADGFPQVLSSILNRGGRGEREEEREELPLAAEDAEECELPQVSSLIFPSEECIFFFALFAVKDLPHVSSLSYTTKDTKGTKNAGCHR